jgi:hypothetical protein
MDLVAQELPAEVQQNDPKEGVEQNSPTKVTKNVDDLLVDIKDLQSEGMNSPKIEQTVLT